MEKCKVNIGVFSASWRRAHKPCHKRMLVCACALACLIFVSGCSGNAESKADGAPFAQPAQILAPTFDEAAAVTQNDGAIDTSHASEGYVGVSATSGARLKFEITKDQMTYYFDLPNDGTPIFCPLTQGDGSYSFRIMRNTSGNNYVETASTSANVTLVSAQRPFLYPNVYCSYTDASACVAKARELTADAKTQGEAVKSICEWIANNITYDTVKAQQLAGATGYIPSPDATMQAGSGICFDYASLGAAMLRSQGIPAQIITGTVSPDNIYHAWIMVYIDGTVKTAQFSVSKNSWSRVDLTFAAASSQTQYVGDGKSYTDQYVY